MVFVCFDRTQQESRTTLYLFVCLIGEVLLYLGEVFTVFLHCFNVSTVLRSCPFISLIKEHFFEDLRIFGILMLRIRFDAFEYIIHLLSNLLCILSL